MTSSSSIRMAAILITTGLALSACDSRTPTSVALRRAEIKLHAMSPNGTGSPSTADRNKTYNEVLTSLKSVADQGRNGETGAAYLLIAQAQAGLAEGPAAAAAEQERLALNDAQAVRDAMAQWLNASALAQASAAYDPSKELAEIDAQAKEKMELRLTEQQKKAAVDAKVADIQRQAKAKSEQAAAKRQEAGKLKSQMANQTATQAEQTLKQAQEITRVADALEVEAANLEAKAAQTAPESGEIELQINKLSSQKDLLDASHAAVLKRAESAKAHTDEARAAAAAAAGEIKKRLTALEARRDGDLAKFTDEAVGGFQAAAGAAKKAGPDSKATSQIVAGGAQQSLGGALWAKAHGLNEYAALLESLAGATPALPDAAQYKSKAAKAREDAKAALDQATEAYSAANDSYQAGGGAKMKERLESVNRNLADIVKKTSGGSKDIRNPDAPKDEAPATGTPSETAGGTAAIDPNSPQGVVQAFVDAYKAGDFEGALKLVSVSDQDRATLMAVLSLKPKEKKLDEAFKAKFGKSLTEAAGEIKGAQLPKMDEDDLGGLNPATLSFKIEGDTATAPSGFSGRPLKLVKHDGKWLIDMKSVSSGDPQQLAAFSMLLGPMGKAMDDVAAEVAAGKYPDAQAAIAALGQKVQAAMGIPVPKGK